MLLAKRGDRKGSWLSVPLNTHIWLGKITCTQQCCNALHSVACEQALHFKWWANAWVSSKAWSGGGKGELATITYKFSFLLHPDKAKYHWLKNNIPEVKVHWWQSWLTHHKFLLMLSEISWVDCSLSGVPEVFLGKLLLSPRKNCWQGRRSPFPSMKNYCRLCGGFFLKFHFGAPACSLHKPAIQKTRECSVEVTRKTLCSCVSFHTVKAESTCWFLDPGTYMDGRCAQQKKRKETSGDKCWQIK